jgi:hypothetical protein
VRFDFFFKSLLLLRGRGVQVYVLGFSPSFDMWKEEGKGVSFFLKTFFSLLSG